MATHSSVLAWRIPGTGEPGGLPSMGSHRVGHDCRDLALARGKHLFPNMGKVLPLDIDLLSNYMLKITMIWIKTKVKSTRDYCTYCEFLKSNSLNNI